MKLKRLLSCALALALALTMAAPAASAATFPDVLSHWAKTYIQAMTDRGMFKGYEDGNFKPENSLTTAEALALCARVVGLDSSVTSKILLSRSKDLESALRGEQSWFNKEFAICLETGILTYDELRSLSLSGGLTRAVQKQDLAVYLVRAMQLGPMAEGLESYPLTFSDTASIDADKRPYVYLLSMYGIVQGDQLNNFSPTLAVTRAVMATLLTRALLFMSEQGIKADLPEYTDYTYQQGTISAITSGSGGVTLLTLNNDLTDAPFSVSLPANIEILENNMRTSSSAFKVGRHARVTLNSRNSPISVRVSPALTAFTGTVISIDDDNYEVTLNVGGATRTYAMDKLTQVQINKRETGDRTLLDDVVNQFNTADCKVDDQDNLVSIRFDGGVDTEEGVISAVERNTGASGGVNLRVLGLDGTVHVYRVPSGTPVSVDGHSESSISSKYKGDYVIITLNSTDASVKEVMVDTVTEYVQGRVSAYSYRSSSSISIKKIDDSESTRTYQVAAGAVLTYEGKNVALKDFDDTWFITAQVSGREILRADCYPGTVKVEGVLTNRTFGTVSTTTATLEITQRDDTVVNYTIEMTAPPRFYRNDKGTTVDKLRVGDRVIVTVKYGNVHTIESFAQEATDSALINKIIQEVGGSTLELTMSDGTEASYSVSNGISVTQNGRDVNLAALKPGFRVNLVISGDQITAIDIRQSVDTSSQLNGVIIMINEDDKTLLLQSVDAVGNEGLVTVNVLSSTTMLEWDGTSLSFRNLRVGDVLQVNGQYSGSSFDAKVILRK